MQTQGDTSLLEHSIFNIELALRENLAPGDPLKPHSVTLYYFLRASGHDRYDSMLSVTIQVSAIFQELHALFAERAVRAQRMRLKSLVRSDLVFIAHGRRNGPLL